MKKKKKKKRKSRDAPPQTRLQMGKKEKENIFFQTPGEQNEKGVSKTNKSEKFNIQDETTANVFKPKPQNKLKLCCQ